MELPVSYLDSTVTVQDKNYLIKDLIVDRLGQSLKVPGNIESAS